MRLATFNLLHGRSPSDGLVDVDRLRDAVAALDADVLGLQEVDRAQPRSYGYDLTAEAAKAMGGTGRFVPALVGTPGERWRPATDADLVAHGETVVVAGSDPGGAAVIDGGAAGDAEVLEDTGGILGPRVLGAPKVPGGPGGPAGDPPPDADGFGVPAYGIALVTRYPVRRWAVARLPSLAVRSPVLVPGPPRRLVWLRDEPRVLLAAVLDTPAGPLTVANTHLSFVPGWNAVQLRHAVRALRRLPGPRVLLGDLNLPGALPHRLTGWRAVTGVRTYPADAPRMQIDHVLGHGAGLPRVLRRATPQMPLSDHLPLVVDLAPEGLPGPARAVIPPVRGA